MSDLAHPVTARLRPVTGVDPFTALLEMTGAGLLGTVLNDAAPRASVLEDGSLMFSGLDLFVNFSADGATGQLDMAICRSRGSTMQSVRFAQTAKALGARLVCLLLEEIAFDKVYWGPRRKAMTAAEALAVLGDAPVRPAPQRVAPGAYRLSERPDDDAVARRIDFLKPAGLGSVPGLPSAAGLRDAVLPKRTAAAAMRQVPLAVALALPLLLAIVAVSDLGRHPAYRIWAATGFDLSDLSDYQQTSAELVDPEETGKD